MEHLNKQQIILLALLVSFVSSIASGIVTVSLMTQGGQLPITQTINRVVERTLATGSVKETIIVKDDEAVVNAINTASKGIVRIFLVNQGSSDKFIGIGIITSTKGEIIARVGSYGKGTVVAHLNGGNIVALTSRSHDAKTGISVFSAEQSSNTSDIYNARTYTPVVFADSDDSQLGQAIVLIGGSTAPHVATGIISSLDAYQIQTSVIDSSFDTDAILVNLLGEVIGVKTSDTSSRTFTTSRIIQTYATP